MAVENIVENYFQKIEREKLKKLREKHAARMKEKAQKDLRDLHYMRCPKCGNKMEPVMMESIEVDKCPECLGIYFDNNELEMLFEIEYGKRKSFLHKLFGLKG